MAILGGNDLQFNAGTGPESAGDQVKPSFSVVGVAQGLSVLVSTILVGVGAYKMHRGRHQEACRRFSQALLVSIFVTMVFAFIEAQIGAVFGLAIDLILLAAISELASQDSQEKKTFAGLGDAEPGSDKTESDGEEAKPQAASGEG